MPEYDFAICCSNAVDDIGAYFLSYVVFPASVANKELNNYIMHK